MTRATKKKMGTSPLGTIHMIGGPNDPNLVNRIQGEIHQIKPMNEDLSVQSSTKKLRQTAFELGSIMFTRANLEKVQHSHFDPLVVQLKINNYDIKRILVDIRRSIEVMYYNLFNTIKTV